MAVSLVQILAKGASITGELDSAVISLINSQTQEDARLILSSLSCQVLAQSASLAENASFNNRSFLNSFLGYEPVNLTSPAYHAANLAPSAGDTPNSWGIVPLFNGRWGEGDRVGDEHGYDVESSSGTLVAYHTFETLRIGAAF
jgi:hypothetical protein